MMKNKKFNILCFFWIGVLQLNFIKTYAVNDGNDLQRIISKIIREVERQNAVKTVVQAMIGESEVVESMIYQALEGLNKLIKETEIVASLEIIEKTKEEVRRIREISGEIVEKAIGVAIESLLKEARQAIAGIEMPIEKQTVAEKVIIEIVREAILSMEERKRSEGLKVIGRIIWGAESKITEEINNIPHQ